MMFYAASLLFFAGGIMSSNPNQTEPEKYRQISKCMLEHNFDVPEALVEPRPHNHLSHEQIKDVIETQCSKFPAFFECAKDSINEQQKAYNPTSPVTEEEIYEGFGIICGKENQTAAVCVFEKHPDEDARDGCERPPSTSGSGVSCEERVKHLECVLPKVRDSVCGAKAAAVVELIHRFERRTSGCP